MDFLKANLSSIAVQLSDNFSEIWSSTCTILFRDEIAILHVFDEDKIAITSLLRRPFPVQASIQLPCFSIEYSRLTTLLSTLLWYFDFVLRRRLLFSQLELSHRRLPKFGNLLWENPIWLAGEHSDPNGMIRTQAFGLLKKATCPYAGGFSLLPSQSPCCFSIPARLYYFACSTKTMMPCSW